MEYLSVNQQFCVYLTWVQIFFRGKWNMWVQKFSEISLINVKTRELIKIQIFKILYTIRTAEIKNWWVYKTISYQKIAFNQNGVSKLKELSETAFNQSIASRIQLKVPVWRILLSKQGLLQWTIILRQSVRNSEKSTFVHNVWSILIAGFYFFF